MHPAFPFMHDATLGRYERVVEERLAQMQRDRIIARIWARDHTVWKPDPDEIANRLGWLTAPATMRDELPTIRRIVESVRAEQFRHVRVLGMGGASLAAEVFEKAFGHTDGYLDCAVIDSTHSRAVLAARDSIDLARTLFIVSIKKYALETVSLFKYFYNAVTAAVGAAEAGAHFVAITDPGTWVTDLAAEYNFRHVCLNDPDIGGRYSPLTYVGLLPAALIGVDCDRFLDRAGERLASYGAAIPPEQHPGAWLGAVVGELARRGRDKLTFFTPRSLDGFADWAEQLLAESTGKEGTGILPVVHEPLAAPHTYGADRLFIALDWAHDPVGNVNLDALIAAGHPVLHFRLETPFDLAEQFYLWCFTTAVAGYCLGINPFDQPDVEASKEHTRQLLAAAAQEDHLQHEQPATIENGIEVFSEQAGGSLVELLDAFLAGVKPGDYIALQAFVPPDETNHRLLHLIRRRLLMRTRVPVTLGFGPRFLHSTGQLHKGDAGNGLFIQVTCDTDRSVAVPDKAGEPAASLTFQTLIMAQALGDAQVLRTKGRRLIRFQVNGDIGSALRYLDQALRQTAGDQA